MITSQLSEVPSNTASLGSPQDLTPISGNPSAQVMVYGAIQAYEYDLDNGLTQEADEAKQFLLNLESQDTFSDGYTQKTLSDFCSLINSGGDVKTWWEGLKSGGLISSDPSKPRLPLLPWTESNASRFSLNNLPPDDQYLTAPNFTLYSNMFFMEVESNNVDGPELPDTIDSFFSGNDDGSANAGAFALQLYEQYDTDPDNPLEPPEGSNPPTANWVAFSSALTTLVNTLDPSGEKLGMFINLRMIAAGNPPYPYDDMHDFFTDIGNGNLAPSNSPWTIWGTYEADLYQNFATDYQQFETDLNNQNLGAAIQDYQKVRSDRLSQDPTQLASENALNAAALKWASSTDLNVNLINNSGVAGDGSNNGATGNLGGQILDSNGQGITVEEYLDNPSIASDNCVVSLPEFYYGLGNLGVGTLTKLDGTPIKQMVPFIRDDDFEGDLDAAFNQELQWGDSNDNHGEYQMYAVGTLGNFMKDGQYYVSNPTDFTNAANTINQILTEDPP